MSLTQLTEVYGCSNRMEKALLMKVQEEIKGKQLKIELVTTDCHCQIKEYLREEVEELDHQFYAWHFCKSIKVKLWSAAKKKTREELKPWIKLIWNHFWWSYTTCEGEEILLKEKWTDIFFHILNKHWWIGKVFIVIAVTQNYPL